MTKTKTPEKVTYDTPTVDDKAITQKAADLSTEIAAITVKDQESYTLAGTVRGKIKSYIDWLGTFYGPSKTALNAAVKKIRDEEKRVIGPRLTHADNLLKDLNKKMSDFLIAEDARIKREAAEEKAQKDKEAADAKKKLEKQAVKAAEKGNDAKAEILLAQAAAVTAAPVEVKKAVSFSGTGTTAKDDISIEIVDLHKFLTWAHDYHKADISTLVEIKYNPIKTFIKGLPDHLELKPESVGVKVEKKKIIASA